MKSIFFLAAILFYSLVDAQTIKPSTIPGNWQLSRHTITKQGAPVDDKLGPRAFSYFEFFSNGTYKEIEKDKNSQIVTKGKWKIIQDGKKLHLFNNVDVPNDPKIEIADHDMDVIRINGQLYITYTYGDVQFGPATDYYKKQL